MVACPPAFELKPLSFLFPRQYHGKRGRRLATATQSYYGRYLRSRFPYGEVPDLALDATLRAAVANGQGLTNGKIDIGTDDLRYKVRHGKTQTLMLLVVDASGSMGAAQRMAAAKQAALSFLIQAYQRRDRVGMITFNGVRARVLLPPTNSITLAQKRLRALPTGGKTPLAHALQLALRLARMELQRQKSLIPIIVVISDGNPNVPLFSSDARSDALKVATAIGRNGLPALFVDTDRNFMEPGLGLALSRAMRGRYERFENLAFSKVQTV
ncbi:MAG: VWA domain-containing protein [Deltaproteobacteria bacterium]|nr:VWA domain-containing protein [Deltaproteobacteria bacterium]MBW1951750.1 VWA domain-containing protein [Deltaproteobacteria bacterium]MBW1986854.1 VWA domain-containing protein [Deltaproteobacteria bacterium]MBW2134978.1 VWA domain-containing protein [Deltaproteobacteria bacterium]